MQFKLRTQKGEIDVVCQLTVVSTRPSHEPLCATPRGILFWRLLAQQKDVSQGVRWVASERLSNKCEETSDSDVPDLLLKEDKHKSGYLTFTILYNSELSTIVSIVHNFWPVDMWKTFLPSIQGFVHGCCLKLSLENANRLVQEFITLKRLSDRPAVSTCLSRLPHTPIRRPGNHLGKSLFSFVVAEVLRKRGSVCRTTQSEPCAALARTKFGFFFCVKSRLPLGTT